MDEAAPSISDFITMRAWKHALFTTYALSLSYFESEFFLRWCAEAALMSG